MAIMKVFTPWNSAMLQNRPYPRELVLKSFLAHHWSFLLTTQYYTIWVLLHFPSRLLLLEATDGILSRHSYPYDPHSSWPLSMGQGQLSPSSLSSYNIVISWVPSDSKFSSWSVSTVLFLSPFPQMYFPWVWIWHKHAEHRNPQRRAQSSFPVVLPSNPAFNQLAAVARK